MDKRPPKEEVKKAPATPRSGTSRATAPTISSQRATGSTISKPPTRPTASSLRRDTAGKDDEKEKRPSSRTTTTTPTTTRRTTLGGATTSAPPRRPPTTSRARPTSPEKTRTTIPGATQAATKAPQASTRSPATESTKSSTVSAIRPFSRDTIPEEPDQTNKPALLPAPSFTSSSTDAAPRSPPKLEIRSTPVLKPQAESDAEAERRNKSIVRHARTQSNVSMPAIGQAADGSREMQALQSMLREKAARDVLEGEKKVLKAEVARLQQQNQALTEAAQKVVPPTSGAEKAREDVAKELEQVKVAHRAALLALESTHKTELEKLHTELKQLRRKSSEFSDVTKKIRAVEEALSESRARAASNEEELQQTIQEKVADRDQLANIIEELKSEIDKCQIKLDADVAKQASEKRAAIVETERVRKELEEERRRNKKVMEGVEKEKRENERQMQETNGRLEREVEDLRQSASNAEKSAQESQDELSAVRKQYSEDSAQHQSESDATVSGLKEELASLKTAHATELEQAGKLALESDAAASDLRLELETLRKDHQTQSEESDRLNEEGLEKLRTEHGTELEQVREQAAEAENTANALQSELETLRKAHIAETEDSKQLNKANLDELTSKHTTELEQAWKQAETAESTASDLRSELETLRAAHTSEKEDAEQLNKDDLDKLILKHTTELEQARKQAEDTEAIANELRSELEALRKERETANELNRDSQKIIDELKENTRKLEQDSTDGSAIVMDLQTQLENAHMLRQDLEEEMRGLRVVIENLQTESVKLQQVHEEAVKLKTEDAQKQEAVVEGLREELEEMQLRVSEEGREKEEVVEEIQSLRKIHDRLEQEHQKLRTEADALAKTVEEQKQDLHKKEEEINEKQEQVDHFEYEWYEANTALAGLREEMKRLQQSHDELGVEYSKSKSSDEESTKAREERHTAALMEKSAEIAKMVATTKDIELTRDKARQAAIDMQAQIDKMQQEAVKLREKLALGQQDAVERETRLLEELKSAHKADIQSLQSVHAQALEDLKSSSTGASAGEAQQLHTEKDSLERHLGDLEMRHNRELEEEAQKHESAYHDLQNAFAQLKESMAEQDRQYKHQLHESNAAHDSAIVALEAGHKDAIQKLAAEHSRAVEEAQSQLREPATDAPKTPAPSNGLTHVFVNHEGAQADSSARRLSETPLAYASEDDAVLSSPTPVYPRDGNRAGAVQHIRHPSLQDHRDLEAENAKLVTALKALEVELEVLKRASSRSDDPFASPNRKRAVVNGSAVGQMSLEGTLESLRIQTEQLLEVQDDVLAENWRFRQRLQRVV